MDTRRWAQTRHDRRIRCPRLWVVLPRSSPGIEPRISREARVSWISGWGIRASSSILDLCEKKKKKKKYGSFGGLTSLARLHRGSREPSGVRPTSTETSVRKSIFSSYKLICICGILAREVVHFNVCKYFMIKKRSFLFVSLLLFDVILD